MAITTIFNRTEFRHFHKEAEHALQALAERHGVTLVKKGGSFRSKNGTLKFEVSSVDADGSAMTPEAESFKQNAGHFGLHRDDLGGTFISKGRVFRITGLSMKRPKYPITAERVSDGKPFKFHVSSVREIQRSA